MRSIPELITSFAAIGAGAIALLTASTNLSWIIDYSFQIKIVGWFLLIGGAIGVYDYFSKKDLKTKVEVFIFLLDSFIKRLQKILKTKHGFDDTKRREKLESLKLKMNP